jgi:hypothetical protein
MSHSLAKNRAECPVSLHPSDFDWKCETRLRKHSARWKKEEFGCVQFFMTSTRLLPGLNKENAGKVGVSRTSDAVGRLSVQADHVSPKQTECS